MLAAAALVALAVPAAWWPARRGLSPAHDAAHGPGPGRMTLRRQLAEGFAAIVRSRQLVRATVTSALSYAGIGMLLVCCPLLGVHRLGGATRGTLLISAIAVASLVANAILARSLGRGWAGRGQPDTWLFASTLAIGAGLAAAALAPGWLTLAAVALAGVGEGPQLTALFAVRHRETPANLRGQVYATAASLKIAGLAAGAALAGPLAGRSLTACLLVAAGTQLCAAAAYLLAGAGYEGAGAPQARARAGGAGSNPARSG